MAEPGNGWLQVIRIIDDLRAEITQHREAIHHLQERGDDWERDQAHEQREFEQRLDGKIQYIGRGLEEVERRLERLEITQGQHLGSHKMRDKEHLDRVEALQQERVKARTALWVQIIILIGLISVALINLVPHLVK